MPINKEEQEIQTAKRAFVNARGVGNHQEEARWANLIGDMYKNRGEYVKALKWLRIDYEVSNKYLPEKQLLPTCQSIGEVYLRLHDFKHALVYQKKHLDLAKDANDLVEQQRAGTQLGRTYHEMFLKSDNDHSSIRNAKKYFKSAMKLAQTLKKNPHTNKSSFLKEYIDAHNNIGMIEMDLDNLEEAKKILTRGLEICDEEEVNADNDCRSRLHHNLGNVYMELKVWDKAQEHIKKDIRICNRIGHCQGEAKGYINLGELHYRAQKYEEANLCYQKALDLAKSMEDEDALVKEIDHNIGTVKEAMKVMDEMKKEEQNLKKLTRSIVTARGTHHERKCLLQQNASLDSLIEKSSIILAWSKVADLPYILKKRIASELCDKEKLGDSFLLLGESYQKLRKFKKAIKWFMKSWETYKSINNLEGQALAKINIGDVLDCDGDWMGALNAFEEGYRIAVNANLPSVQLSALENMHYSHMIRFDNEEEARRLQHEIEKLKSENWEIERKNLAADCCSETDTEGDDHLSDCRSNASCSQEINESGSAGSKYLAGAEGLNDDLPLISLLRSHKNSPRIKSTQEEMHNTSTWPTKASPQCFSKTASDQQTVLSRKRIRIVLSDDEDEMHDEVDCSRERLNRCPPEDVATSNGLWASNPAISACAFQGVSTVDSKCTTSSWNPNNNEESTSSYKSRSLKIVTPKSKVSRSSSNNEVAFACDLAASGSKCDVPENLAHKNNAAHLRLHNSGNEDNQCIVFRIDNDLIQVDAASYLAFDKLSIESMTVELACLYYLQLPTEKRSKGLLPIVQHMKCDGRVLDSMEAFETLKGDQGNILIEVSINGWVQKRLMKLYIDCCEELSEAPNMKLLKKLYISEVEDEVIGSECELQDISVTPLLNALHTHKTVAVIDLSHNFLGNGTMEKLQQFLTSGQKYGDLTLDLHCNRFGPTALFQICECPVLFARLEVLNISGNRLTDACGSYLSTILESCRGYNNPISGNAIINLLAKLATLKSFAALNLSGLKLTKPVVDSLCQLAKTSCLSRLMLGSTGIGTDGALQLTASLFEGSQESVKLDLSYCGLMPAYTRILSTDTLICGILELNLAGNPIMQECTNALVSLLTNPRCCLKVLVLDKCQLGLTGILQMIQALGENDYLEELHLADNANLEKTYMLQYESAKGSSDILQPHLIEPAQQGVCVMNTECNQLEVADSEDGPIREEAAPSDFDDSCTSSCQKNSLLECQFIQELTTAISMAKQLQFMELSNNGFTTQVAKALYAAWSSRLESGLAWRHIEDQTIHFSMETNKCCRVKPCCRRD
uniref:Protein TONSOKU n=1 Tax=Salix viminalis TaxID=40686 RepID=A0A6N2LC22_SALVM